MTATIFIDGEAGTTGLQIRDRLSGHAGIDLIRLGDADRKDVSKRRQALNDADVSILCLPDDAAREAVSLIDADGSARVIDASTAHRVADGWTYGMPELNAAQSTVIAGARWVTNPGCYANASVSILAPLIGSGLLPADWPVTINAVSGYSGGGKGMISSFEDETDPNHTEEAFRVYGLGLAHKHVPEIQKWTGLANRLLFVPSVGRFRQGMIVQVPLQLWAMPGKPAPDAVHSVLADHYDGCRFVTVVPQDECAAMTGLQPEKLNGTNELRLHVFANAGTGQAVVMGLLDNLGKGASGLAVQNLNLMLGIDETTGLV
ncbi:MAG: N-acetyl-gamma-glutamyl-phosphate reductase [Alphaproteobacteria bacterium]